nr:NnrS family protein [Alphaproteobacteria bacterium]
PFTTNYLRNHGETILPHQSVLMTRLAVLSAAAMVVVNQVFPDTLLSGLIVTLVAIINAVRFAGWRGQRILRVPILWVLFLGYGFVILGLAADAMAILGDWLPRTAADHLLTIGGIGCMTLGVMTRATLGHTGRETHASPVMATAFIILAVAALLRAFGPTLWPEYYAVTMAVAGIMWVSVFSAFTVTFWPILTRPRIGQ